MKRKNCKGMTLIELIVASSILIIIMGAISIFLSSALKSNEVLTERQNELSTARIASHYIINYLHSNDEHGKINIISNRSDGIDIIEINIGGGNHTYIFYSDYKGGLIKATAAEFNPFMSGEIIAEINSLELEKQINLDTTLVKITITYSDDKETINYVTLKAN